MFASIISISIIFWAGPRSSSTNVTLLLLSIFTSCLTVLSSSKPSFSFLSHILSVISFIGVISLTNGSYPSGVTSFSRILLTSSYVIFFLELITDLHTLEFTIFPSWSISIIAVLVNLSTFSLSEHIPFASFG